MSKKEEIALKEKEQIRKPDAEPTKEGVYYSPEVDIYESEEAITLLTDLPGIEKKNLDIDVEDKVLTITGHLAADDKQSIYSEYKSGGYSRTFKLGDTIDQAKISATLKDGVLELVLPKAQKLKPRKIEIAAG
jgi:HSP20 family protein